MFRESAALVGLLYCCKESNSMDWHYCLDALYVNCTYTFCLYLGTFFSQAYYLLHIVLPGVKCTTEH